MILDPSAINLSIPGRMGVEGVMYEERVLPYDPSAVFSSGISICSGCASATGTLSCSWYVTRVNGSVNTSVFEVAQLQLGSCGAQSPTHTTRRIYVKAAPLPVEAPGENGYVPDSFIPGEDIHAVTKILCK